MLKAFIGLSLPVLLVFGLYHLLTWFNIFRINERAFWKRVAAASAAAHVLLLTGFLIFSYFDYKANQELAALGLSYGAFLFDRSAFTRLLTIFDPAPMAVIFGLSTLLARFGLEAVWLLPATLTIAYLVGTLQWYVVGGAVGAVLERFWSGLKTGDEEDEDWFSDGI